MTKQEATHRWANQIANKRTKEMKGDGGNVFFEGPTIYSYGRHYPMGHLYGDTAYINTQGYSVTTSQHISATRSAINPSTHPNEYCLNDTRLMERVIWVSQLDGENGEWNKDGEMLKIKIENEKLAIPAALREFKKRTKRLKLIRYNHLLGCLNAVRELQGKKLLKGNTEKMAIFEKDAEKSRVKSEKAAKIRELNETRHTLKNNIKRGLMFRDPANKNGLYYSEYAPITLEIDGNRVKTSNHAEVSLKSAKSLLSIWETCLKTRTGYFDKQMDVDGIVGVCIRRNGTVKIGCTRILPDAVRKLSLEMAGA